MENNNKLVSDLELRSLIISELSEGKEMCRQLEMNLDNAGEVCLFLVTKMIDSYNRVLSMLKPPGDVDNTQQRTMESEDEDMEFKDHHTSNISDSSKKRKATPRWSKQVQVYPGSVSQGTLHDGHNWRKYGQKDILGAKYPRGYYRCTQRNAQGCLATKQVQRTDDNPTIFEITYRGKHTCSPGIASSAPEKQQEPNVTPKDHINIIDQQALLVSDFETSLRVETNDMKHHRHFPDYSSFNFPPPSSSNNVLTLQNYPFSSSSSSSDCLIHENLALDFPPMLLPSPDYYTNNLNVQITDQEMMAP